MPNSPRIAIVYDWLDTRRGGAEQVLQALHQAFSDAPLFTSHHVAEETPWLGQWSVTTSWLQHLPAWIRRQRMVMILSPLAFEMLDLSKYDVVISVTSATAKGVLTKPQQLHVCYLLTPPRYLYSHPQEYLSGFLRFFFQPFLSYLSRWDRVAQSRPDRVIPISHLVQKRASVSYDLQTDEPLYPPVKLTAPQSLPDTLKMPDTPFFLVVSRMVSYKKVDTALQACSALGLHLVVVGSGPMSDTWRASSNSELIEWWGDQEDDVVQHLMSNAEALLMPGEEDFGITALEAAAQGTPTILHNQSGVAEILTTKYAVHLADDTVESMKKALSSFEKKKYPPQQLKQIAQKYATTSFVRHWQRVVTQLWKEHTQASKGHS